MRKTIRLNHPLDFFIEIRNIPFFQENKGNPLKKTAGKTQQAALSRSPFYKKCQKPRRRKGRPKSCRPGAGSKPGHTALIHISPHRISPKGNTPQQINLIAVHDQPERIGQNHIKGTGKSRRGKKARQYGCQKLPRTKRPKLYKRPFALCAIRLLELPGIDIPTFFIFLKIMKISVPAPFFLHCHSYTSPARS